MAAVSMLAAEPALLVDDAFWARMLKPIVVADNGNEN